MCTAVTVGSASHPGCTSNPRKHGILVLSQNGTALIKMGSWFCCEITSCTPGVTLENMAIWFCREMAASDHTAAASDCILSTGLYRSLMRAQGRGRELRIRRQIVLYPNVSGTTCVKVSMYLNEMLCVAFCRFCVSVHVCLPCMQIVHKMYAKRIFVATFAILCTKGTARSW